MSAFFALFQFAKNYTPYLTECGDAFCAFYSHDIKTRSRFFKNQERFFVLCIWENTVGFGTIGFSKIGESMEGAAGERRIEELNFG